MATSLPVGVTLTMGYDAAGDRTLLEDSLGGTILSTYDTNQELTTETYIQSGTDEMEISQAYNWQGQVTEQADYSYYSGDWHLIATENTSYNAQGQVSSITQYSNGASETIADYSMEYDGDQELTQQTDHGNASTFAYDALGELTTYGSIAYGTTTQNFDNGGNPDTSDTDATTLGNELTAYVEPAALGGDTFNYKYDDAGNLTQSIDITASPEITWTYAYDDQNHMTSAVENNTYGTRRKFITATTPGATWSRRKRSRLSI